MKKKTDKKKPETAPQQEKNNFSQNEQPQEQQEGNKDLKNPADYGYKGDEKVEITGFQFRELLTTTQAMLAEEIREYYPEHTKWVNREYQEASQEEVANGKAFEVMDLERILQDSAPTVYYTRAGKRLLRLRFMLEQLHAQNIDNGVAVSINELKRQAAESQRPKMTKV